MNSMKDVKSTQTVSLGMGTLGSVRQNSHASMSVLSIANENSSMPGSDGMYEFCMWCGRATNSGHRCIPPPTSTKRDHSLWWAILVAAWIAGAGLLITWMLSSGIKK
jgi:hypothetical protein